MADSAVRVSRPVAARELLRALLIFALPFGLVVLAATFVAWLLPESSRGLLQPILWKLDLRLEHNLATWYSGAVFLICALSFALVGWSPWLQDRSRAAIRRAYKIVALTLVFLSADEVATIHETIGQRIEARTGLLAETPIDGIGFFWVLAYAPLLVLVVVVMLAARRLVADMPSSRTNEMAGRLLLTAVVSFVAIGVFEIGEVYFFLRDARSDILPCFEEASELVFLFSFAACNLLIAEGYDL